jgi:hypothetical protein
VRNWKRVEVLKSGEPQVRIDLRTWAIAASVGVLSAIGALYVTRPAPASHVTSSHQPVGRTFASVREPDPLTADEIGYQVPRDRIKAIDAPGFISPSAAGWVPDRLPVIGVSEGAEAKAYPIPLLSRVEIVNDQTDGRAIAVTW